MFKIPNYLVEPNTDTLLQLGATLFLAFFSITYPLGFVLPLFRKEYKHLMIGRIVKMNAVLFVILVFAMINLRVTWSSALIALAAVIYFNLVGWGLGYLLSLRNKNPMQKTYELARDLRDFNPLSLIDTFIQPKYHYLILVLITAPFLFRTYGMVLPILKPSFNT